MTSSSRKIGTDRFFSVEDEEKISVNLGSMIETVFDDKKIRFVSQNVIIWICGDDAVLELSRIALCTIFTILLTL